MTAKIEGASWTSNGGSLLTGITLVQPGYYIFFGSNINSVPFHSMAFQLYNIGGPGTYALGVGPSVRGGAVAISDGAGSWASGLSGLEGSVTVSALTDSTITGMFEYTVSASAGTATGTRTVTDGDFHLKVMPIGVIGPLPDNQGSELTATIDDALWGAASAIGALSSSPSLLAINTSNTTRSVLITFNPAPSGPGTYDLSGERIISVTNVVEPQSHSWTSLTGGDGTITISSLTATRIRGEFSGTLGPVPLGETSDSLAITGGTFDVGIQTLP